MSHLPLRQCLISSYNRWLLSHQHKFIAIQHRLYNQKPLDDSKQSSTSDSKDSSSEENKSSSQSDDKKRVSTRWFWYSFFLGGTASAIYLLGQPHSEQDMVNPGGVHGYLQRSFYKYFEDPAFEKLLPDQVIDPAHPRPYTLVLDLDRFLVCHQWDNEVGRWRIAKRPGVDLFLFYAAQLYEVVVFSSMPQQDGEMIVRGLDRFGCISHSLFRYACKYRRGTYLKDIGHLNRDLGKIIVMGHDKDAYSSHADNFIPMPSWSPSDKNSDLDQTLEHSLDFLEQLAFSRQQDLRPMIRSIKAEEEKASKLFPASHDFAIAEQFEKERQERIAIKQARQSSSLWNFFFGSMTKTSKKVSNELSSASSNKDSGTSSIASTEPTYWEKKEQRVMLRRKEYGNIKKLMQKQLEQEMAKEKAYYDEHRMTFWDMLTGSGSNPAPPPEGNEDRQSSLSASST